MNSSFKQSSWVRRISLVRSGLFGFALLASLESSAQNSFQIFPRGLEGNTFSTIPFTAGQGSVRYQQVYDAAGFIETRGNVPYLISSIEIRANTPAIPQFGIDFFSSFPAFQINLSTTARSVDGLSATFSENVGADDTVIVPRGPFTVSAEIGRAHV